MFFSIIVPVYKAEKYIHQCIQSILEQEFDDFELILIDDGSPDLCPAICDEYSRMDARVRVIHQKNGGVVKARQTGARYASGEYIVTVDSDDYIGNDFLSRIYQAIDRHHTDIVAFGAILVGETKTVRMENQLPAGVYEASSMQAIRDNFMFDAKMGKLNFGNLLFSLWSKAIKRELLVESQMKVPAEIRKGDDLAVITPILYGCDKLVVLENMEYFYRFNPDSVMHTYSEKDIISLKVLTAYLEPYCGQRYRQNLYMYVLKMCLEHLVGTAVSSSNYRQFRQKARLLYDECINDYRSFFSTKELGLRDGIIAFSVKYKLLPILYLGYRTRYRRRT